MGKILLLVAAAGGLWLYWRHRRRNSASRSAPPAPESEYVCHLCGEHDCICHKKDHRHEADASREET